MTIDNYQQLEKKVRQLRSDLDILKQNWNERNPRKATGGIAAISGFYCQFVLFLLECVKSYLSNTVELEDPQIFIESLSDIINTHTENVVLLSEVKRTQSWSSISKALKQLWDIYELSFTLTPALSTRLHFRILSTRRSLKDVQHLIDNWTPDGSEGLSPHLKEFRKRTKVEVCVRPEEELLTLLVNKLKAMRPREIVEHWLGKLLRAGEQGNFQSIAHDIWEDLIKLRQSGIEQQKPDGIYVWTNTDHPPDVVKQGNILTGAQPTVRNLREGYFAHRDKIYNTILNKAESWFDEIAAENELINRLPIFWIGGRSGCGKSVALLHILSALYDLGRGPILYLGNKVDLIPVAINWAKHIVNKEIMDSPVIIAVDDPYSPTTYQDAEKIWQKGLSGLEDLFQGGSTTEIPMLICCGPTEQAERLQNDFLENVELTIHEIPIESKTDYESLRSWYRIRVAKEPPEIGNENVLLIQLFFEWEVGLSLREFGKRFYNRIQDMDCETNKKQQFGNTIVETISKILSLNRIYTGYPEKAFNHFITPDIEHQIHILRDEHHHLELHPRADQKGYWIAHPHLANTIFESWYPANKDAQRINILQDAIIDCIQWGENPSEQMAPLWALSQWLFAKEELLTNRLDRERIPKLLQALYRQWPSTEDTEISLAHLPVWIQLSVQCPELGIKPEPTDIAIERLTTANLDKKGLRLTCHKLLEHFYSFTEEKQKQINESLFQFLSSATNWIEWPAVVQDALYRTKDPKYCSLVANWIIENNLSNKTPRLLLIALKLPPDDQLLLKVARELLINAGPELIWGDIAIQLLNDAKMDLPPKEVIGWASAHHLKFESCFLLGRLLHQKVPKALIWAMEWLKKFHLEPSANYVLEPFCLLVDNIPEEVREYCINYIETGYKTSERLLELLIKKFPEDKNLRLLGFDLLNKIPNENAAWSFVWRALIQSHPDHELVGIGKEWLKRAIIHHKSWRFIWEALWLYEKDQELYGLARKWLTQVPLRHDSWSFVWQNLWNYKEDDELVQLGRKWLKGSSPYHPTWKFVWEPLWIKCHDNELKKIAESWLILSLKENVFWGIVWEHLWETDRNDTLALLGRKWLIYNFENASWSHVWGLLWEDRKGDDLSKLGRAWLSQRIEDQGWGFVWRTLFEYRQSEELIYLGKSWLNY